MKVLKKTEEEKTVETYTREETAFSTLGDAFERAMNRDNNDNSV
jgi:hypothetical protein